ncbi:hypothetical protein CDAR_404001 [Caerostris darwini]|uniref:Uncharacterized protein n=1 Tax=Caerostris darwini TaxID=1538125 RepID=A0AAV4SNX8_9ARAC|nr:hypothetical protein CDAR_404001 [Caerostris darwini]
MNCRTGGAWLEIWIVRTNLKTLMHITRMGKLNPSELIQKFIVGFVEEGRWVGGANFKDTATGLANSKMSRYNMVLVLNKGFPYLCQMRIGHCHSQALSGLCDLDQGGVWGKPNLFFDFPDIYGLMELA